ncbi:MAG: alpha/beta fold hydrolase [Ilumatobacter sp.]|jgi:haloalkane dehalogenase|uniref:alpha/beta fold hydrolase n=1 Tax=Ilumatobacter sp. TaxID=1967498 RepID=UPI003919EB37
MSTFTSADANELFRAPPTRFLDTGSSGIAYRRVGAGPDVLFVHGWPVSGATFRTLLPYLVDHVTCHLIDLPGTGSSRFDAATPLSIDHHIESVRLAIDVLELDDVAVVGHDSGGMIARHAVVGDPRVRAMGLIDTEPADGVSWRFKAFLAQRRLPGFGRMLGWVASKPRLRRNGFVLGDAFVDASRLDGEFDEFFLRPLYTSSKHLEAGLRILRSFDYRYVRELAAIHPRIDVPVQLVWGEEDVFFPVGHARRMVGEFPDARIDVISNAGLFSHEERPAEVAAALLATLTGSR